MCTLAWTLDSAGTKMAQPVAIEEWAEQNKDSFKPPICNKVAACCVSLPLYSLVLASFRRSGWTQNNVNMQQAFCNHVYGFRGRLICINLFHVGIVLNAAHAQGAAVDHVRWRPKYAHWLPRRRGQRTLLADQGTHGTSHWCVGHMHLRENVLYVCTLPIHVLGHAFLPCPLVTSAV